MPPSAAGIGVLWLSTVVLVLSTLWLLATGGVGGAVSCATMAMIVGFSALPCIARADKRRTVVTCVAVAALAVATAFWAFYTAGVLLAAIMLSVAASQIYVVRHAAQTAGSAVSGNPAHR